MLLIEHKDFFKEWNFDKNSEADVYSLKDYDCKTKYWWKCEKGHEWQSSIRNRIRFNRKCPICNNRPTKTGLNDGNRLSLRFPFLIKEWNYDKNNDVPNNINSSIRIKYWWKCEKGHEWQAFISDRGIKKSGCPYCANRLVDNKNNLLKMHPNIAKQWNYEKNKGLLPENIVSGSDKSVWWRCGKGHEWQASCKTRVRMRTGCPYCRNLYVSKENCLEYVFPELAKEWHPTKNGNKTPKDIVAKSAKRVWWKCKNGHEWSCQLVSRTISKSDCPYCSGNKVCDSNCLQNKYPDVSKEWDYKKNSITPNDVTFACHKSVWWKCKNGHSWKCVIKNRTIGKSLCPSCSKITLKNGASVDSLLEAWYYLFLEENKVFFIYNKKYSEATSLRYDFYIPEINTYIEVTSFANDKKYSTKQYIKYLRKIAKKKKISKNIGANFVFIQRDLTKEEKDYVMSNIHFSRGNDVTNKA